MAEAQEKSENSIGIKRVSSGFVWFFNTVLIFLLVAGALYGIWDLLKNGGTGRAGFGSVAGLILIGFAVFVILMGVLSFGAKHIKIENASEPFGLPEGTVRAILTIAFIVLVGVLSAFLITSHSARTGYSEYGLVAATGQTPDNAKATADKLRTDYKLDAMVAVVADNQDAVGGSAATTTFSVLVHPRSDTALADDIAKQMLTMISTILAAMIGFYFAARTAETRETPLDPASSIIRGKLMNAVSRHSETDIANTVKAFAAKEMAAVDEKIKKQISDAIARLKVLRDKLAKIRTDVINYTMKDADLDKLLSEATAANDEIGKIMTDFAS